MDKCRLLGPTPKFWVGWSKGGPRNLYSERAPPWPTRRSWCWGPPNPGQRSGASAQSSCGFLGPTPRDSDSDLGVGAPRVCISNPLSGDTAIAGSRPTLRSAELNPGGRHGQGRAGAGDGHFAGMERHSQNLVCPSCGLNAVPEPLKVWSATTSLGPPPACVGMCTGKSPGDLCPH